MSRGRVAVVDDNHETLDLLRDILTDHGYEVEVAPAVDAGLHEIRDARPDIIIVDLLLSTDQRWLSGWDVVRLARSHAELHRLPIVVISADPGRLNTHRGEAARLTNVRLLPKPFGVDEIVGVVTELLDASAAANAARDGASQSEGVSQPATG
ncbi:MAG TPA: response regulator [Candidatus Limnocylindria bacterium]|nr:response regulator [Candidatus Limnocylindria bacterium]